MGRLLYIKTLRGLTIKLVDEKGVYRPGIVSKLMANCLSVKAGDHVLDLGTGSGFLAIVASKLGATSCVATDISQKALRIAKVNAELNHVSNIDFREGDLYQPVDGELFDLIVSNPPMTPSPYPLSLRTYGGPDGRLILDKVIEGAIKHLKPNGRLLVPTISIVGIDLTAKLLSKLGMSYRCVGYTIARFSKLLRNLEGYILSLPNSSIIYDREFNPCWSAVIFEAKLAT